MKNSFTVTLKKPEEFIQKAVCFASGLSYAAVFISNHGHYKSHNHQFTSVDALFGFEALEIISHGKNNGISTLSNKIKVDPDWYTGFIGYDIKNELENLTSGNADECCFPEMFFWKPRFVFTVKENQLTGYCDPDIDDNQQLNQIIESIKALTLPDLHRQKPVKLNPRIGRDEYIEQVTQLKNHIHRGDIYEINFCQEFFSNEAFVLPENVFLKMLKYSPTPFSAYFKMKDQFILSASPERFLKKTGATLISQPIKGTIRRSELPELDKQLAMDLRNNIKEQTENVMIVDLVRNDLSKIAQKNSVHVSELFGIYAFPQVYQMISTIEATLRTNVSFKEIIRSTFPMGSMTGAPKIRAMQLIEEYEASKRGAYSGTLGYITPWGDFDFNVIIRSILYNKTHNYLSCSVGSAITAMSDPEQEYEECLLKLTAMESALNG